MTVEDYYAIVKRLGLTPSRVPNVYRSAAGDMHNVPDATRQTDAQRAETIERLKLLLGVGKADA